MLAHRLNGRGIKLIKIVLGVFNTLWMMLIVVFGAVLFKAPQILIEIFGPAISFMLIAIVIHFILYKVSLKNSRSQRPEACCAGDNDGPDKKIK